MFIKHSLAVGPGVNRKGKLFMNKFITKIATLSVGLAMAIGVGVAVGSNEAKSARAVNVGDKVTSTSNIENNATYYIGATVSDTDYYWSTSSYSVGTGLSGTSVTNKASAPVVKLIGSGTTWAIQFSNGNYLSLASSKANGKVDIVSSQANWTVSENNSLLRFSINGYLLQKNSGSSLNFGSYSSGQKDIWLELVAHAATGETVSITNDGLTKLPLGYAVSTKLTASAENFSGTVTFTWTATQNGSYVALTPSGANNLYCTVTSKSTNSVAAVVVVQVSASNGTVTKTATSNISLVEVNTVTESISLIDTGSADDKLGVFTHGYVNGYYKTQAGYTENKSEAADITQAGQAKFFFSADGSAGTDATRIEAYNCLDLNKQAFSEYPDLGVEIVIYGDLTKYNNTYEYNANCYLVFKAVKTVESIAKTSDLTKSTYTVGENFSTAGLVVTATYTQGGTFDATSKCTFSPANGAQLDQEYSVLTITYSASNSPTTTSGSNIVITIPISVTYPSAAETIAAIAAIGTVEYTDESHDLIVAARTSYDALPVQSQANVTNYAVLTQAESDFEDLILENVSNVESLISAIGTVTLESGSKITAAETAYSALLAGDLGKSLVSNYSTLTTARSTYDGMVADKAAVDAVEALIDALPSAASITDYSNHADIVAARTAYNALTSARKEMVDSTKLAKLVACEEKDAMFAPKVITIQHSETTSTNLTGGNDASTFFGLDDTIWSIVSTKNGNNSHAGLNKDGTIRLYAGSGNGTTLTVSVLDSTYTIETVTFTFGGTVGSYEVTDGSSALTPSDDIYTVNGSVFTIQNVTTGANTQVYINKIEVEYSIEESTSADDFLDAVSAIPAVSEINASNLTTVNGLISTAENEYEKLTAELKTDSNVIAAKATLDAAKAKAIDVEYEIEAADTVTAIANLPSADSITDYSHHAEIAAARAMYESLSAEAKAKVTNYSKLQACEAADAEHKPASFDIDTDGGSEHVSTNSTASTACNTSSALETAYPIGTTLASWKEGSTAYTASGKALKLGSGSATGSVTISFTHNRHYATTVTLDAYSWGGAATEISVNGVTHTLTGYSAALVFDLTAEEFSNEVVISTTSTNDKRVTIYGISIAYAYRADYSAAKTFEEDYILNPAGNNIPYPSTTPTGIPGTDCLSEAKGGEGYYDAAIDRYNSNEFGAAARLEFATHADFANARERLTAWALANGKVITFNTTTGAIQIAERISLLPSTNSSVSITTAIVVISTVALAAIGGYFFLRKRKEN